MKSGEESRGVNRTRRCWTCTAKTTVPERENILPEAIHPHLVAATWTACMHLSACNLLHALLRHLGTIQSFVCCYAARNELERCGTKRPFPSVHLPAHARSSASRARGGGGYQNCPEFAGLQRSKMPVSSPLVDAVASRTHPRCTVRSSSFSYLHFDTHHV
jgi:hypothetical protein